MPAIRLEQASRQDMEFLGTEVFLPGCGTCVEPYALLGFAASAASSSEC